VPGFTFWRARHKIEVHILDAEIVPGGVGVVLRYDLSLQ
jgi:hypothetical protein